jgi:hypothetical protein
MKFCKDCKHFIPAGTFLKVHVDASCGYLGETPKYEPVYGGAIPVWGYQDLATIRSDTAKCGPDAVAFEIKE